MRLFNPNNKKGQATTELAIMGSVVLMVLLFLAQQGFIYNARQGLEMYTFRQALLMSKNNVHRGVDLTTMRDVAQPSFLSGINRQRIMASASVDANPWDLWVAEATEEDNTPAHIDTYQIIQMGEAMLQNGHFIRVPVTKIKVVTDDDVDNDDWRWMNSQIRELDAQRPQNTPSKNTSTHTSSYGKSEDETHKTYTRNLTSADSGGIRIIFQDADKIKRDYVKNDWEDKIKEESKVSVENIPVQLELTLDENLRRETRTNTPH